MSTRPGADSITTTAEPTRPAQPTPAERLADTYQAQVFYFAEHRHQLAERAQHLAETLAQHDTTPAERLAALVLTANNAEYLAERCAGLARAELSTLAERVHMCRLWLAEYGAERCAELTETAQQLAELLAGVPYTLPSIDVLEHLAECAEPSAETAQHLAELSTKHQHMSQAEHMTGTTTPAKTLAERYAVHVLAECAETLAKTAERCAEITEHTTGCTA